MKRILLIFSLIIVHFWGTIDFRTSTHDSTSDEADYSVSNKALTSDKNTQNQFWEASITRINGVENVLLNFGFNFQELPTRINNSTQETARIRNFKILVFQKLYDRFKINHTRLAVDQFNGYYIYHLRKLLI